MKQHSSTANSITHFRTYRDRIDMEELDIRWMQRFANFQKALLKMNQAIEVMQESRSENKNIQELLQEGVIQRFEYTHELAWKVMKDYAEYQGYTNLGGSRDALRKAFEMELIADVRWMESIRDRNLTSHNYDDETAHEIFCKIEGIYLPLFNAFEERMNEKI